VAEVDVPESGRYIFRFQYRVGDKGQQDESLRVILDGRGFDFTDRKLENSLSWEWSPKIEVGLEAGLVEIEFLSTGKDSVHVERVRFERVCECGH
jgi:hypothetical protein